MAPGSANHVMQAPYALTVIMERVKLGDRWGSEQWAATGVVPDTGAPIKPGEAIFLDGRTTRFLHPGCRLTLRADEAEGYLLNITSPHPRLFILWRRDEGEESPCPRHITASFNEGARWMDGGESVDGVPLPPDLVPWIAAFAELHYRPEPRKKGRWASNRDKTVGFRG